ncbi:MAG TPA: serine--tRNA ligase [Myxococcota bacterium]|nr:serine--tRNA ligase [Myxococcota bacterium]
MLDPKLVENDPELVRAALTLRNADEGALATLERVAEINGRRRAVIQEGDACRALRNELSPQIGQLYRGGRGGEATALKTRVADASQKAKALETEQAELEAERDALLLALPNLVDARVTPGKGEEDNVEVRSWGVKPALDFEPRTHDELGAALQILDFERGAKLSGARFTVLRGVGAKLERGLVNLFLHMAEERDYTEVMVPYIVWRDTMAGTGQLPKFEDDLFKLSDPLNGQDGFLIPTAEVPVTNLHRDEILEEDDLPIAYACFTPCFRAEAGSYGKDTKGLIRQHQFHKVELVRIARPEDGDDQHELLTKHAEEVLQALGLPYRVMRLCGGDLGFSARHCYDLEVWLPGQGKYREISSCSTFGDFQARRMKLRYRPNPVDGKKQKARLATTINGSALAVGRTLVAILENYQQADGSIVIPEVLRPFVGGLDRIAAGD